MAKQVILAVAGAGKTYHICNTLDPEKRNLILSFTHENLRNIKRELSKAHGAVPIKTTVQTFDAFLYHDFILPYECTIRERFEQYCFKSKGITTNPSPLKGYKKGGKYIPNPLYSSKTTLGHYINKDNRYYCDTLAELAIETDKKGELIARAAKRLNKFYDAVWIDEFQDFRKFDHELLMKMAKYLHDLVLVGDYYQHSVSAVNNSGKPFDKLSYKAFVDYLTKEGFEVDCSMLKQSVRCSEDVCEFVSKKLNIAISSSGIHGGKVAWLDEEQARQIINDSSVPKLVYNNSAECNFDSINWSYSKGNTLDSACVILTKQLENLSDETFSASGIPQSTINKLYVAITRARGDLYLVKKSIFDKLFPS